MATTKKKTAAKKTAAKKTAAKKTAAKKTTGVRERAFILVVPLFDARAAEKADPSIQRYPASPYDALLPLYAPAAVLRAGRWPHDEPILNDAGHVIGRTYVGEFAPAAMHAPGTFVFRVNLRAGSIEYPEQVAETLIRTIQAGIDYAAANNDQFTPGTVKDANDRVVGYWKVVPGPRAKPNDARGSETSKDNGRRSAGSPRSWALQLFLENDAFRTRGDRVDRPAVAQAVQHVADALETLGAFDGTPTDVNGNVVGAYGAKKLSELTTSGEDAQKGVLRVKIDLANVGMQTPADVAYALRAVARSVEANYDSGKPYDQNGNAVGTWSLRVGRAARPKKTGRTKANDARPVTPDSVRNFLTRHGFTEASVTTDAATDALIVKRAGVLAYHPSRNRIGRPQEETVNHNLIAVTFLTKGEGKTPTKAQAKTKKARVARVAKKLKAKYQGVQVDRSGMRVTLDATKAPTS